MSFSRTIKIKNGDLLVPFHYYKCDLTDEEIPESDCQFSHNGIHLSEKGMDMVVQAWIRTNSLLGGFPIVFHYLFESICKPKRPYRYVSAADREQVLKKYKHTCNGCGSSEKLEIDHVIPVSKGGKSEIGNLQVLCKTCNLKKSNK